MENYRKVRSLLRLLLLAGIWITLSGGGAMGQMNEKSYFLQMRYRFDTVEAEFKTEFPTADDQQDYRKLRGFLHKKRTLQEALMNEFGHQRDYSDYVMKIGSGRQALEDSVRNARSGQKIQVTKELLMLDPFGFNEMDSYGTEENFYQRYFSKTVAEVQAMIERFQNEESDLTQKTRIYKTLQVNLEYVTQDVESCEAALEAILTPEYKDQDFRRDISKYFAILIAVVIIGFLVGVIYKSNGDLSKQLLSNRGLQFITLFVLIIAIILFGVLGILKGSELAALLAGISGYILGKGIPTKTTPPPPPPSPPTAQVPATTPPPITPPAPPAAPTTPVSPVPPAAPVTPETPGTPATPVTPVTPETPVSPTAPVTPETPASPAPPAAQPSDAVSGDEPSA